MKTGVEQIAEERIQQLKDWPSNHDDVELICAAIEACEYVITGVKPKIWPCNTNDRRSNLVWAGALIAAELDRMNRMVKGVFKLLYKETVLGTLTIEKAIWTFKYSDDYPPWLRPLTAFPDIKAKYSSSKLWPFFYLRIPKNKSKEDTVQQLRLFGRRTISNPFELVYFDPD